MADQWVVLGVFQSAVEANLARGRLEAEGVRSILTGGNSVSVFGGVGGLGGLRLHVQEADARRAAGILVQFSGEDDEGDGPPEDALWLCPLCGNAVADGLPACLACGTPRPSPVKSLGVTAAPPPPAASSDVQERPDRRREEVTSDAPLEAVPSAADGDVDVPDLETLVGDDLVRRAFRSALFPILIPYSFWLLARIGFYPGKISPRMTRLLYWTFAIDLCWLAALLLGGVRIVALLTLRRPF